MKFTRIITFSIISVLSLGTLVTVAEINQKPVNRIFKTEDTFGNREVLENIELENIIKVDSNKYEKVILTDNDAEFRETQYDPHHGVGEKVLNNKSLYRNTSTALDYEDKELLMTVSFDQMFAYNSEDPILKIAKKDKATDKVTKKEVVLPSLTTNAQIINYAFLEVQGELYYAIVSQNSSDNQKPWIILYHIQKDNLNVQEVMKIDASIQNSDNEQGYTDISNFETDGKEIFTISHNSDNKMQLIKLDPKTKKHTKKDISGSVSKESYINKIVMHQDELYVHTDTGGIFVLNKESIKPVTPKALKTTFDSQYSYIYSNEQLVKDDKVYVTYEALTDGPLSDTFIVVFDKKSGETLYIGKLPNMNSRGVGKSFQFVENK